MISESPEIQRLTVGLAIADFYLHHPITESFANIDPRVLFTLLDSLDPSVLDGAPITPTGISVQALQTYRDNILNILEKLRNKTLLESKEIELINTIPPNLPELVVEMEAARDRKDLTPGTEDRLSANLKAAKRTIVENWERRRLEVMEEKLKTARKDELDDAKNSVAGELLVYAKDEPAVNDARFDIAEDIQNIILTASKPENPNRPRKKEEIYADINEQLAGNTEKNLVGLLIQKYGLSAKTAQEVSVMVLANQAMEIAIENARKTIFVEHALANQFPKLTSVKDVETVNPEALHNLADETMVAIVSSVIQPIQEEQPKQAGVLSTGLFKVLITKIIPPFNSPFLTSPASMTQGTREPVLVETVENFLQKHLSPGILRSIGSIRLDTIQSLILEAAGFSNTSWWKSSTASLEGHHPFGLVHPQIRNSIILNHGSFENLVALIPNGLIPSIKEFFNTNRGSPWFVSFTKSAAMLPHLRFQFLRGISLPLLGRLYRQNEWGYWMGPLSRFKNTVFSKTFQFFGSNLIRLGSNKIMAGFLGKVFVGLGTKLLGIAGGPAGLTIAFTPQILSLLRHVSPAVGLVNNLRSRLLKIGVGLVSAGLLFVLNGLANLGAIAGGAVLGGTIGGIFGFIITGGNPLGALAGGAVGSFLGTIIASIVSTLGGGGATAAATTTTATAATSATSIIPAIGSLTPAGLAAASVLTATLTVGAVSLYDNQVYQAPFLSETREMGPSRFLDISVKELKDIFEAVTNSPQMCVPVTLLKAISNRETGGIIFTYDESQVQRFSAAGWEQREGIDQKQPCCDKGTTINYACNNNTCSQTTSVSVCPPTPLPSPICDVVGPMQFEVGTFGGYAPLLEALWNHVGPDGKKYSPSRANLKDAIWAAALKIKANSGKSDCGPWDDDTIIKVAKAYCGNCGWSWCDKGEQKPGETFEQCKARVGPYCGENYCGEVLNLYRQYQ